MAIASVFRSGHLRRGSAKVFLIQEFDAEDAVLVTGCHRGPLWVYGPFDANDLTVRIIQRRHVGKGKVAGNLAVAA